MSKNIRIIFDNKRKRFLPGDIIVGKVIILAKKDIKCKGLNVTLHGFCSNNFKSKTLSEGSYFNSKNDCYNSVLPLIQGSKLVRVGHHTFNFRYRLPQDIPPSFESQWGFIRHYAEAVLQTRSLLRANFKCSEMITVVSTGLDFRKYPDAAKNHDIVLFQNEMKQFSDDAKKPDAILLRINSTTFICGENVMINKNSSSKQFLYVKTSTMEVL
ncbi:hypothetical protein Anas_04044 [Armadillidium nasatum]|uniref:Arrestin-like N-terminal domain-containing protein n=1 Tax=Armadillidium nasatum TaxID=96803 RepID=A0A5N5SS17_9CRUS|nr:hypothetical protein Anas_04044 [Armadillidium nasatum]